MEHHRFPHHFTASGLVVAHSHILLVNHKRIGGWVPPGGHIEECEMPHETVVREILEETGVEVEVLSVGVPQSDDPDAFFLPSPLFLQSVLAIENGMRFYHVDFTFRCRPTTGAEPGSTLPPIRSNNEVKEARWVHLHEVFQLPLAKNVKEALALLQGTTAPAPEALQNVTPAQHRHEL